MSDSDRILDSKNSVLGFKVVHSQKTSRYWRFLVVLESEVLNKSCAVLWFLVWESPEIICKLHTCAFPSKNTLWRSLAMLESSHPRDPSTCCCPGVCSFRMLSEVGPGSLLPGVFLRSRGKGNGLVYLPFFFLANVKWWLLAVAKHA